MFAVTFSLIPREWYGSVLELDGAALKARGITLLLLDLDNTISPYRDHEPVKALQDFVSELRLAGVEPFILSNSRKPTRVQAFAEKLGVPYLRRAGKPRRGGFMQALEMMGRRPEEAAMAGDQIFTDILGANRAGIFSILVQPMRMDTVFRLLRYGLETPFRRCAGAGTCGKREV